MDELYFSYFSKRVVLHMSYRKSIVEKKYTNYPTFFFFFLRKIRIKIIETSVVNLTLKVPLTAAADIFFFFFFFFFQRKLVLTFHMKPKMSRLIFSEKKKN